MHVYERGDRDDEYPKGIAMNVLHGWRQMNMRGKDCQLLQMDALRDWRQMDICMCKKRDRDNEYGR